MIYGPFSEAVGELLRPPVSLNVEDCMKQLIEFIPLIVFFIVAKLEPRVVTVGDLSFQLGGVISATAVLIILSLVAYGWAWYRQGRLEKGQSFTLAAIVVMGGLTVILRDEVFLKWKAPIVNWVFALAFWLSGRIGQAGLAERLMGHTLTLSPRQWKRLNHSWTLFFLVLGSVNWAVAFLIPGDFWIDFKVFGNLLITSVFVAAQIVMLRHHLANRS